MDLSKMIYSRKSTRSFESRAVDESTMQKIKDFFKELKPLYPDIKVRAEVVSKDSIKCILPWRTPHFIAIFSENKEGMYENAGFMFQQLDLYMQSLGLGVCWLGMGRMKNRDVIDFENDKPEFVIMMAFGYPKGNALRNSVSEFKRRSISDISDTPDERLEPARLAPSSVNSQPWYFVHEGDVIHTYCAKQGLFNKILGSMNLIDIGICLAHMCVANPDTFRFYKAENVSDKQGYGYIGSFTI